MGFEDLAFLFNCGWNNRGQIRMNFDEAALLFKTVASMTAPRGAEIGRYHGGSTVLLAHAVGPIGFVDSIDLGGKHNGKIRKQLTKLGMLDRVRLRVGNSTKVRLPDHLLDFVFIDGDHSYVGVRADQDRWGAAVRPGGFVIHHDMTPYPPGTKKLNGPQRVHSEIVKAGEPAVVARAGSVVVFQYKSG
jgi:predicted O-methyltransferase YrrM